jgi:RNA polymerase sigma factor (TIGR02999 family)
MGEGPSNRPLNRRSDRAGAPVLPPHQITELLKAWSRGDQAALHELTPLVYRELYRCAHHHLGRERDGHPLETAALVNELYLRLVDLSSISWRDRAHFLAMSSRLLRRVLVDAARADRSLKRGGRAAHIDFDSQLLVSREPRRDLLALDDALNDLALLDPRKSDVVELRFFGGLTVQETADVLAVSPETIKRDWRLAKAWLRREMKRGIKP